MKLAPFQDIIAADDRERCNIILGIGGGFCFVQQKYNGVNCRAYRGGSAGLSFRTSNDKLWPSAFFGQTVLDAFHQLFNRLPYDAEIHAELIARDPRIHLATLAGWVNVNSTYCEQRNEIAFAPVSFPRGGSAPSSPAGRHKPEQMAWHRSIVSRRTGDHYLPSNRLFRFQA